MNIATIKNPMIQIKPSKRLYEYVKCSVKVTTNITSGIQNIISDKILQNLEKPGDPEFLFTETDKEFIDSLPLKNIKKMKISKTNSSECVDCYLTLGDLHWLYKYICDHDNNIYFHELFEGSKIILPKNDLIPRNEELEKRCQRYRNEFYNREYHRMTNAISYKNNHPHDTVAYQLKEMNKHIIAVAQFVLSVLAGFAFGFTGIELISGTLDFGFRLLLGIICALIIALAELYFLAKKLNEGVLIEEEYEQKMKSSKLD